MAPPRLADELLQETVRFYIGAGRCAADAAEAAAVKRQTFESRLKVAAQRGFLERRPGMPGYFVKSFSQKIKDGVVQSESVHMALEPEGGAFQMPEGHRAKSYSINIGGDGVVRQQWVKTIADQLSLETICEQVKAALSGIEQSDPVAPPSHTDDDLATIYIAADWHVGLLAYKPEVGHNYDIKIARRTIETAMSRLIAGTPASKQAVVLGLGDLLHSDGYANTTARSNNQLDVDGRYPLLLQTATRLIRFTINEALKKHEHVLVRILPGNHDDQSAIAVTNGLALHYENDPRVTVDNDFGAFWWWSWGSVLLGATHGDQAKMKDLPLIMASRNAEAWGASKFRHVYTGHIHTQTGIELSGVTVESFQTPVATDAWHHRMGYGANRSVCAITHHKTEGEICRNKVNIL